MTNDEKIAALRKESEAQRKRNEQLEKRIEQLEEKAKPPAEKKPFVPQPYEPIDWTARMSMPRSAIMEMAQHPCNQVMRGVINDRHAPTSPSMAGTTGAVTGVHRHDGGAPVNTSGW